jgi:hypothetical protein
MPPQKISVLVFYCMLQVILNCYIINKDYEGGYVQCDTWKV